MSESLCVFQKKDKSPIIKRYECQICTKFGQIYNLLIFIVWNRNTCLNSKVWNSKIWIWIEDPFWFAKSLIKSNSFIERLVLKIARSIDVTRHGQLSSQLKFELNCRQFFINCGQCCGQFEECLPEIQTVSFMTYSGNHS